MEATSAWSQHRQRQRQKCCRVWLDKISRDSMTHSTLQGCRATDGTLSWMSCTQSVPPALGTGSPRVEGSLETCSLMHVSGYELHKKSWNHCFPFVLLSLVITNVLRLFNKEREILKNKCDWNCIPLSCVIKCDNHLLTIEANSSLMSALNRIKLSHDWWTWCLLLSHDWIWLVRPSWYALQMISGTGRQLTFRQIPPRRIQLTFYALFVHFLRTFCALFTHFLRAFCALFSLHFLRTFCALFTRFLRTFYALFYALFTHFLRTFYALFTHFLHTFYAVFTHFFTHLLRTFLRTFYALFTRFLRTFFALCALYQGNLHFTHFLRTFYALFTHFLRTLFIALGHGSHSIDAFLTHFLRTFYALFTRFLRTFFALCTLYQGYLRWTHFYALFAHFFTHFLRTFRTLFTHFANYHQHTKNW